MFHLLEKIAASVSDTGGVYFVPAFSGLFAPYWRSDARGKTLSRNNGIEIQNLLIGLIMGMTQYTTKAHIVRAALEGICYQTREVKYLHSFVSFYTYLLFLSN